MIKFFNILNRKFTIGNLLTIIASFIFAIILRQSYLHYLDFLPIRGELEALDISYFGIVVLFRFIFSAFLEYLLNDKFSIPLFEGIGGKVGQTDREIITLGMVNSDNEKSSTPEDFYKNKDYITKRTLERAKNPKFHDEMYEAGDKMENVLKEQSDKILKLHSIGKQKNVEFYEENGALGITVPQAMTDSEGQKLSKEIGAIDRSLQNKFSEYKNLSTKDVRLYEST